MFDRMAELSLGRMVLFISHRLSTVRSASEILVLRRGAIIEQGSHEALMELNGTCHRLFTLQVESYIAP
ncbi:hypothetical protein [Lysobacter sp. GCM10012299]|uniref:hypothetical protein n=1 Tax=Lysobacter sp. GCM10012299 TaxID=3317333 RepID=UPI003623DD31